MAVHSAIPFDTRRLAAGSQPGLAACAAALDRARGLAEDTAVPPAQRIAALDHLAAEFGDPTLNKAIQACQKLITTQRFANWSELILYCHFATAPVVREMQALHNPPGAPPVSVIWPEGYCVAALILELVRECRRDYLNHDRVFLPADWLREAGVEPDALDAERTAPGLRKVLDRVLDRVQAMLADAAKGAAGTKDRRFRRAALNGIAHRRALASKLCRHDPLATIVALNRVERCGCTIRAWMGR